MERQKIGPPVPELPVSDVERAQQHYRDVLGFEIGWLTPGKELGAVWMPAGQSGTPMTYSVNGRQFIVIAVSGGNYSGEYLAFALPAR